MSWTPESFGRALETDPLAALGQLSEARADGSLRADEAIRVLVSANCLLEVAVLLARQLAKEEPSYQQDPLMRRLLVAPDEFIVMSVLRRRTGRNLPARTHELIRTVTEGRSLNREELDELISLLRTSTSER